MSFCGEKISHRAVQRCDGQGRKYISTAIIHTPFAEQCRDAMEQCKRCSLVLVPFDPVLAGVKACLNIVPIILKLVQTKS